MRHAKLTKLLGYECKDLQLLDLALTHRSVGKQHNERIEFLGDGVVNLVIADALYRRFPEAKEGELSRLRAALVKGEALAELARELMLGDHLMLGLGEKKSGGHNRSSILAGGMEAVIGAIYLDSGYDVCKQIVLGWYDDRLKNLDLSEQHIDAKTRLQEVLQGKHYALPRYEVKETIGQAHQQVFVVTCTVENLEAPVEGRGPSRRKAEQDAAKRVLEMLKNDK